MSAVLASFLVVVLAEMGDKTQLIALTLGLRYRRPWTVMLGILIATLLNHTLAAALGALGGAQLDPRVLGWILGVSFVAFGVWTLFPDRADTPGERRAWGPLVTTIVVFFFAEMGDKTQLATVALGARYAATSAVTLGTTAGMLVADGLAVFAGSRFAAVIPLVLFRRLAAALFFLFGIASILGAAGIFETHGGPRTGPPNPPRSEHPGQAVMLLEAPRARRAPGNPGPPRSADASSPEYSRTTRP